MDNPLFNTSTFSPSPGGPDSHSNPIWSTEPKPRRGPDDDHNNDHTIDHNPTSTVKGMRALGLLQSPQLQSVLNNNIVALPIDDDASQHYTSAAAAMGRDRPEELHFADILSKLVSGDITAADAIASYAEICKTRANELKDLAAAQLQRAPRYLALQEAAAELEAESATWQLLWHLYGIPDRDFPAGKGGNFIQGAGFYKTYRQHAADLLYEDAELNRAGRAVAWLESLAASNDPDPEQGLARKDGLWQETKGKLGSGPAALTLQSMRSMTQHDTTTASSTLVTQLDPDATTRQQRKLDADNIKDENRLMKMVWRLLRSGRAHRAAAACIYSGQPWRAASMTFAGVYGPLPLGASAEEADADLDGDIDQLESMAGEVTLGIATSHSLWRWACYKASERIASTNTATGMSVFESAVYAMLSGNVSKALHACTTWEDTLWVYLRCWLECAVDAEMTQDDSNGDNGNSNGNSNGGVSVDVVPERLRKNTTTLDTFKEGLAVSSITTTNTTTNTTNTNTMKWPIQKIIDQLPKTFEEVVERGGHTHPSSSSQSTADTTSTAMLYRRIQLDLIQEKIEGLIMDVLVERVIHGIKQTTTTSSSSLQQQHHDGVVKGPPCSASLMRCAAHLAIMFYALDVTSTESSGRVLPPNTTTNNNTNNSIINVSSLQVNDALQRLIQAYAIHLIDTGVYAHVPLYACHLRSGLQRSTYLLFIEHCTALGDVAACHTAYTSTIQCLNTFAHRIIDTTNTTTMHNTAITDEFTMIIKEAISKGHMDSTGGPVQRALYVPWLCFSPSSHVGAVRWACALCREYSLGGIGGINAAMRLFNDIIPTAMNSSSSNDNTTNTTTTTTTTTTDTTNIDMDGSTIDGVELLLSSAEQSGAITESNELRFWRRYYEIESEVSSWEGVYMAAVEEMHVLGEQPETMMELARDTVPLLEAVLEFLREDPSTGWLAPSPLDNDDNNSAMNSGDGSDGVEIAVVIGPDEGMDAMSAVLSGEAYPTFSSSQQQSEVAIALVNAFDSAAGKLGLSEVLTFHAGAAPEEGGVQLPGLVSVAIDCKGGESVQSAAVMLLASALKGSLVPPTATGSTIGPFVATNISANSKIRSLLCQTICYPRLAIKAAALRQAIAYMGLCEGDAVVNEVADVLVAHEGILGLFNENEIAAVKEQDSTATALLKKAAMEMM